MDERTITGTYLRRRDGRHFYTFEARWEQCHIGCCWEATVRLDGAVVGKAGGKLDGALGWDWPMRVQSKVEHCIEHQIGVPG